MYKMNGKVNLHNGAMLNVYYVDFFAHDYKAIFFGILILSLINFT